MNSFDTDVLFIIFTNFFIFNYHQIWIRNKFEDKLFHLHIGCVTGVTF